MFNTIRSWVSSLFKRNIIYDGRPDGFPKRQYICLQLITYEKIDFYKILQSLDKEDRIIIPYSNKHGDFNVYTAEIVDDVSKIESIESKARLIMQMPYVLTITYYKYMDGKLQLVTSNHISSYYENNHKQDARFLH